MDRKHTAASISQSYCGATGGVNKLHMSRLWSQQSGGLQQNHNDGHEKHWWQAEKVGWIKKKRKWGRIRWDEKRRETHSITACRATSWHFPHWFTAGTTAPISLFAPPSAVLFAWKNELMFTCDLILAGWMGSYFQLGWQPNSENNGQLLADLLCICWRFCQMLLSWLAIFTKVIL